MAAMARRLLTFVALLQISRVGLVFTAISNIWLVVWLSSAEGDSAEAIPYDALAGSAAVAVGMYIFGMTLNDVLDMRRDRVLAPDRPLPSRRIRPATATILAFGALLVAIAASVPLGTRSALLCTATAAMVLFYNGPGKHIAGLGVLTLGLIRGAHMLIADPGLGYLWPVWLTITHVVGLSALCHRLEDKRPLLLGAHLWIVALGWAFVSVVMIGWMEQRDSLTLLGRPWIWAGPAAAIFGFLCLAVYTVGKTPRPQAAGGLLIKYGLIWLIVYDTAWLAGAGLWLAAAIHAMLIPATWLLMAAVRWLKLLAQTPAGFQR